MIRGVTASVLSLALPLAACGALGIQSPRPPTAAQRGHEAAQRLCAACHAVEPGVVNAKGAAPAFAGREMQHLAGLEGRVETLTREGHYAMPPQHLTPGEVADLVAYIDSLKATKGEPTLNERPPQARVRPQG